MGICVKHEQCPRCAENGNDNKGNNLAVYEDDSCYCFACGYTRLSEAEKEARGLNSFNWFADGGMEDLMAKREKLTTEEVEKIKAQTGERGNLSRGIPDEVYKQYRVRFGYDEQTGEVNSHYYPYTEDNKASGYKLRKLPKEFSVIGKVGSESDLFGQAFFRNSTGKFVLLCAGEVDTLSAYSMLNTNRDTKYDPIPCVSAGTGENGSHKQIAKHYSWFDRFEKIVVIYDQDDTGREAVKSLVKVLPKGKMFVVDLPSKDINKMLEDGKQQEFVNAFWKHRQYTPDGILGSGDLHDRMIEELSTPKIPLPPFMHKLQKMMAGGIPLGRIVNLGSASGTGKSTIVDEMLYFWVFNSPHKIGIVSLESDAGQYGIKVLSRHCSKKIELFETPEEAIDFINSEVVRVKEKELFFNPDGTHRWHLVDERDGGLDSLKHQIEKLIVECECKVIVLDPLQDVLDGLSNEDQAVFLRWMKGMVKSHKVTFINVNHVRKNGTGQKANSVGGDLHEEDFAGSSTIFKSGACNLLFSRDKEAEDEIERNTTRMKASKIRWTGRTGIAGEYYYDIETHTLFDKEDWISKNGVSF